jgi:hypothetical protein
MKTMIDKIKKKSMNKKNKNKIPANSGDKIKKKSRL